MKRGGILHPELCALLASTGHTDWLTICDRGFPVPMGVQRIDLALVDDIPTVLDVLRALREEFVIDRLLVAQEMEEASPHRLAEMRTLLPGVPIELVPHTQFKAYSRGSRGVIRTGDTCPYANVIVVSG